LRGEEGREAEEDEQHRGEMARKALSFELRPPVTIGRYRRKANGRGATFELAGVWKPKEFGETPDTEFGTTAAADKIVDVAVILVMLLMI